jgi:hypothetical protein
MKFTGSIGLKLKQKRGEAGLLRRYSTCADPASINRTNLVKLYFQALVQFSLSMISAAKHFC